MQLINVVDSLQEMLDLISFQYHSLNWLAQESTQPKPTLLVSFLTSFDAAKTEEM